jgi:hypothetical protein
MSKIRHLRTSTYAARVEPDGDVLVWDRVAGHYSRHHQLTEAQVRYVRARAR